ncbi:hypothetical protein D3C78_1923820 [compost metagenome]
MQVEEREVVQAVIAGGWKANRGERFADCSRKSSVLPLEQAFGRRIQCFYDSVTVPGKQELGLAIDVTR